MQISKLQSIFAPSPSTRFACSIVHSLPPREVFIGLTWEEELSKDKLQFHTSHHTAAERTIYSFAYFCNIPHNLAHMFSWFNNAYIYTLQSFLKCPTWSAFAKRTRHIFVRVLNCFEGSACDKTGTVCQPARSRGTPSTERATCLGPGDVGGSTKRCRHLRLDKSHWQTICHSVTASITDQKHQWQCKGHSMKAMGIPRWTCNDVLTFFVITTW